MHGVRPLGRANMTRMAVVLILAACPWARAASPSPAKPEDTPANTAKGAGWVLAWSDEFENPGAPDPAKWSFFTGMTKPQCPVVFTRRPENIRVENGRLILEARLETFRNPGYRPGSTRPREQLETVPYTSGRVETRGRFEWQYGRMEVRIKPSAARGTNAAIWTMGKNYTQVNWPRCGEIDVLEYLGRTPDVLWHVMHFANDQGGHASQSQNAPAPFTDGEFHTLAVEWDEQEVRWFVDGQPTWSFPLDSAGAPDGNPYRQPHFLILSLSVGGWGGDPDPRDYPTRTEIEYVRVYSRAPAPATP